MYLNPFLLYPFETLPCEKKNEEEEEIIRPDNSKCTDRVQEGYKVRLQRSYKHNVTIYTFFSP